MHSNAINVDALLTYHPFTVVWHFTSFLSLKANTTQGFTTPIKYWPKIGGFLFGDSRLALGGRRVDIKYRHEQGAHHGSGWLQS